MATTVTPTTGTVTITESLTLNGMTYGNSTSININTQGQADQRIMNIATGESFTDILFLSTVDSNGQIVAGDFGYFRITNLDDVNFITLELYVSSTVSSFFKLEAGESFILMSPDMDVQVEGGSPTLADITKIRAKADSSAVDIEYLALSS